MLVAELAQRRLEVAGDGAVQALAPLRQDARVGGVLDECVLEHVAPLRVAAALADQIGPEQLCERAIEIVVALAQRLEHAAREEAANHRGAL